MEGEPTVIAIANVVAAISTVLLTNDMSGRQLKSFLDIAERIAALTAAGATRFRAIAWRAEQLVEPQV